MMRTIRLIADDYGLSPGVCGAILDLIDRGRLTGTGCMTGFPEWEAAAKDIGPFAGRAAIGLHLTLTDQPALTGPSSLVRDGRLPPLSALALPFKRGSIAAADIHAELDAQHGRFVERLGREPDFIDGHQHVHFLPAVRDWLRRRFAGSGSRPALRGAPALPRSLDGQAVKTAAVAALARGFDHAMERTGFRVLKPLSGIYDWRRPEGFVPALAAAVADLPEEGVFMCHPGRVDAVLTARDPMQAVREVEFAFLASDEFAGMLDRAGAAVRTGVR
ncbi:ChbG/HpnK family deacetylase [Mesorhizobium sp. SP-1A]|uniref:ChbG/HpnK family deacetylase n=1 Tax=Mesorhizobium sp. SP-1A TaxID=3077840 RepID=UPI0028F6D727|nr:ChbG/HpnK family deacetylase [Mesorhizobium sp. SP-1A]